MSEKKLLIKNIASLGVVQIVNYIFPLITIPYISRIIGPTGLGTINYITAFVAYFTLIVGYGFDLTATRKIAYNPTSIRNRRLVFSQVMNARFLLFIGSTIVFIVCIFSFDNFRDNLLLAILTYINVVSVLLSPQYIFQGLQYLSLYGFVNLARGVINTILIFLLIKQPDDYIIYAAIGIFLNLLNSIFFIVFAWNKFNLKFSWFSIKSSVKLLISERYIFFSSVIFSLYTSTNIVILGIYEKPDKIAYYTVAVGFINIVQSVINIPLSTSLFPFLGNSFSKSVETGINQLKKILPIVFYLTFFCGIGLLILAPLIIKIIYGHKFLNAIVCIRILAFLPLISSLASLLGVQTMLNLKMDKEFIAITFRGAIISIILNFILGYYFSYIGTTYSYLITEIYIIIALMLKLKSKKMDLIDITFFKPKEVLSVLKTLRR